MEQSQLPQQDLHLHQRLSQVMQEHGNSQTIKDIAVVNPHQEYQIQKWEKVKENIHLIRASNILNRTELEIYKNELNSPKLDWLDEVDFEEFVINLMDEILLLTGADEYTIIDEHQREDEARTNFKRRLQVKTIENLFRASSSIMNLTTEEVKNAFYLNNNGAYKKIHQIYHGKTITAAYIGSVMADYCEFKIRRIETQHAINKLLNPPPEKPIPIFTLNDYKGFIQKDYEDFRRGDTDFIFNIHTKYLVMRKLKIIIYPSLEAWKKWYEIALKRREKDVRNSKPYNDAERLNKKNAIDMYEAIKETNVVPRQEHLSTIYMLRKLVYFRFFTLMDNVGIGKIFEEISHTEHDKDWGMHFVPLKAD